MPALKDKFPARCTWVRHNDGIVKAMFEPTTNNKEIEYLLVNLHTSRGWPEEGKVYWIEIQPAFPH